MVYRGFTVVAGVFFCFLSSQFCFGSEKLLSEYVKEPAVWFPLKPNSEQRFAFDTGASLCEMILNGKTRARPAAPSALRAKLEHQTLEMKRVLGARDAEFEVWPVIDDSGRMNWAFARWRVKLSDPWMWLNAADFEGKISDDIMPVIPRLLHTKNPEHFKEIFEDFMNLPGLYDKPLIAECAFTTEKGEVVTAWNSPDRREELAKLFSDGQGYYAHVITQPARFNEKAITFRVRARKELDREVVYLPRNIEWLNERPMPIARPARSRVRAWPADYELGYSTDIRIFSGEDEVVVGGKKIRFTYKNNADPKNQLELLNDYLEERYRRLGIKTIRQKFWWRGQIHSNVIAVIEGSNPRDENFPVLLGDHTDTAFSQKRYELDGTRVSAPGADDNVSAVAGLLRAAEVLRHSKPKHDIWLVHFTGEEYPADDLGARHFVEQLLRDRRRISGLVLMDMIGYRKDQDKIVQISAGDSVESEILALEARDVFSRVAPGLDAVIRRRFDRFSYLYNTDGIIFSDVGYPVMLLNEHLNGEENLERDHYHEESDTTEHLDLLYATAITKAAIETVARISQRR